MNKIVKYTKDLLANIKENTVHIYNDKSGYSYPIIQMQCIMEDISIIKFNLSQPDTYNSILISKTCLEDIKKLFIAIDENIEEIIFDNNLTEKIVKLQFISEEIEYLEKSIQELVLTQENKNTLLLMCKSLRQTGDWTFEVAINKSKGGFAVSKEVYDLVGYEWDDYGHKFENDRSNFKLIAAIKRLGKKANSTFSDIEIVKLTMDEILNGYLCSINGLETIVYHFPSDDDVLALPLIKFV